MLALSEQLLCCHSYHQATFYHPRRTVTVMPQRLGRRAQWPRTFKIAQDPWICDVQARPHFVRDCNAGGSLVRRECSARGGDVRFSRAECVPGSNKGGKALPAPEACRAPCLSTTAASCDDADADPGTAVSRHAGISRAIYLQGLGPLGFEELLAKVELAHRQVTSRSVLIPIDRATMAPQLDFSHPVCSYADACSGTDFAELGF